MFATHTGAMKWTKKVLVRFLHILSKHYIHLLYPHFDLNNISFVYDNRLFSVVNKFNIDRNMYVHGMIGIILPFIQFIFTLDSKIVALNVVRYDFTCFVLSNKNIQIMCKKISNGICTFGRSEIFRCSA